MFIKKRRKTMNAKYMLLVVLFVVPCFAVTDIFEAIENNDVAAVEEIIAQPDFDINQVDNNDNTPLGLAALYEFEDIMQLLLQYGEDKARKDAEARAMQEQKKKQNRGIVQILHQDRKGNKKQGILQMLRQQGQGR
jgi:ankyrin repeat protein